MWNDRIAREWWWNFGRGRWIRRAVWLVILAACFAYWAFVGNA